jgi:hypothetical protein
VSTPSPQIDDQARELASRESAGVTVVLLWQPRDDTVTLAVSDSHTGEHFEVPVASNRALEAFYHPFAYGKARAGHHTDSSHQKPSALRASRKTA